MSGTSAGGRKAALTRGQGGPGLALRKVDPMNAVEKALRHIEQLQKRLIKAMPAGASRSPRATKSVKRAATKRPEVRPGKRVVGAGRRGSTPRVASGVTAPAPTKRRATKRERRATVLPALREPFVPPVTQPDVSELVETFAPPPTPPDVEGPITPVYAPRGDSAPPLRARGARV